MARLRTFLLLVAVLLVPLWALAQAASPDVAPPATGEGLLIALIATVGAASVSLVTSLIKRLIPRIPRALLPTVVIPALGVLAAWVASLAAQGGFSGVQATLITLGALYARETWDTVREHGLDPVGK